MTLAERRQAEIDRYPEAHRHPRYDMKPWRQEILREWLGARRAMGNDTYLDVGCGKAETLAIAEELGWDAWGCDVVDYLCERDNIDLIEGAHSLPYVDSQFDLVSCNDVLEHILEEDVPAVLSELSRVARVGVLLGISRKPGPLHITINSSIWWMEAIRANMAGVATEVFADRIPEIKQPYLWVEIRCG